MAAYGHRFIPVADDAPRFEFCGSGDPHGCDASIAYQCFYLYASPRLGREIAAMRRLCQVHAARYAERLGIALPEMQGRRV